MRTPTSLNKTMFSFTLFLLLILFWTSAPGQLKIAITEILKDPFGSESLCPGGKSHEFVEFVNLGSDTFPIEHLFLSDGSKVDSVIPWHAPLPGHSNSCFNRSCILPGQFALILDRDYADSPPDAYYTIADSTVILSVDASSIVGGLTMTKGVFLFRGKRDSIADSLAAMIDSGFCASLGSRVNHTQPQNSAEGFSTIPTHLLFPSHLYQVSPDTISPGSFELMREKWICEYKLFNPGLESPSVVCSLAVLLAGNEKPAAAAWRVRKTEPVFEIQSGILNDSAYPSFIMVDLPKDSVSYEFFIEELGTSACIPIDISHVWLPESPIKINEIFPRGTSSIPEWFELFNTSSMPVNLKNWRFGTPEGIDNTVASTDLIIKPGHFLVLTKNSLQFSLLFPADISYVKPLTWQSLDNYRDSIFLISPLENKPIETVYYEYAWFSSWDDESLERVSVDKSGLDKSSWSLSEKPSPGQPNPGVVWKSVTKPSMRIGPIPFTPNNDRVDDSLCISITLPAASNISIAIYGFNGRKLYDVPEPINEKSRWNGRTFDGRHAPAGPFFVIATITSGEKHSYIKKKGVLWR